MFDGDGNGDERRLNGLMKLTMKWCHATPIDGDPEDDIKIHAKLQGQMQILEAINKKAKIVQKVTSEEAVNYENLVSIIEDKIEIAKKEIQEIKEKLEKAKKIRRNRLEYDAVAVEVSKLPNKEVTAAKLEGIRLDLVKLREIEETVEDTFQQRQKQFLVLVQSANRLKELLDQESDDEEIYIEDDPTNEQQDEAITDSNNLVNVSNSTDEEMETGSPIDEQG